MRSYHKMKRDHGRIHTLLEGAENELITTSPPSSHPGTILRSSVIAAQAGPAPSLGDPHHGPAALTAACRAS